MIARKIELMHEVFGKDPEHKCNECSNFICYRWNHKNYYKCKVYADTDSEASDWRIKYIACGMFNQEWSGKPIMKTHIIRSPEPELEGQTSFDELFIER